MKISTHFWYIGGLILLVILLWLQEQNSRFEIKRKDSVIAEKNAQIEYHEENGKILASKIAATVDKDELGEAYPKLEELIKEQFKLSTSQVRTIIQNEFSVRGEGSTTINNFYDSTKQAYVNEFKIDDGYLSLLGSFEKNLLDYQYFYSDTATTVLHSNKKWYNIFKKEQLYATTMLNNPNSKITNTTNVVVGSYRPKRFSIGIGVGYDPFRNAFTPNIGVYYSLIKF